MTNVNTKSGLQGKIPASKDQSKSEVRFIRTKDYQDTKQIRVYPNTAARTGLHRFLELKRQNPYQAVDKDDYPLTGPYPAELPGIMHAKIAWDVELIYRVIDDNTIALYGFYTHDELGFGSKPNRNKAKQMAKRFANTNVMEDVELIRILELSGLAPLDK